MKIGYLLIFAPMLIACGARTITNKSAQIAIIRTPQGILEEKDVDVVGVRQVSGSEAIAETRLKTAFRLERIKGQWVIREVRIGHCQWEKIDNLSAALEAVRTSETRAILDKVAAAIHRYRETNGRWPEFRDYVSLSDILSPRFLTPLIRLDAWRKPLEARLLNATAILLLSAGPDGAFDTPDDIRKTVKTNDDGRR